MKQGRPLFVRFAKPILFIGIALVIAGIYCYVKMPMNLFPEVLFPRVTVIADAGEQPVERMMVTVTKPLESALKRVPGVSVVKSYTGRGSTTIDVYFNWGLDIFAKKTELESRINEIKGYLPAGTVISTEAMNQSLYPVYGFRLESKTRSAIQLRDLGMLTVRPLFSQVKGISNVVVQGGKKKEFVVIPDVEKMTALGITPAAIKAALAQTDFVSGNGKVAGYHRLYLTITDTRVKDAEGLRHVLIKGDRMHLVHLGDIAKIEITSEQEFIKVNADGNDAVLIDIVKQPGINLLDFAKDVEAKAQQVRKVLPAGCTLKPYYNQSQFVSKSIHGVIHTICEGLVLALIVVWIFLRSWRASLVVMITIPVTIAFSVLLIYIVGITINVMSLGAIAASVGLIIDDAVVIIEQIYREHEEYPTLERTAVVSQAIRNLFPAMVASSLSTIVIHFPFRLMSGLAGSFFRELSDTMQITMLASFLVTWLLLPVLHLIFDKKKKDKETTGNAPMPISPSEVSMQTEVEQAKSIPFLSRLYDRPYLAFAWVALLLGGGWWASTQMETGFLPDLDEGSIVLDYHSPEGTDIEETDRMCREMERIIRAHPDVETYARRTGFGMSFDTHPANFGDYLIQLKPDSKETTEEVTSDLRRDISARVPLITADFGQRISDLLGDLMSTPKPIEIKLFGNNYDQLKQLAARTQQLMEHVKGVVDIDNGLVTAGPSLVCVPDADKLAQYGITLSDFRDQLTAHLDGTPLAQEDGQAEPIPALSAMTGGLQIGAMEDGEQMRRILMRFTDYAHNSPEKLAHCPIFLPSGTTTRPLSLFARFHVVPGEIEEHREDLKSVINITARLEGRDIGSTVRDLRSTFDRHLTLPQGYQLTFGGAYAEQQQSFTELLTILSLAILLVFVVLMFLFRRWMLSVSVLALSVLSIGGSLILLWATHVPLNVSSYTGIIMVVGITAENAIFTVHQYRMNRKRGGNRENAVDYAISLRLRPKLMTAISAVLALMPLAMDFSSGAQMQQPLAVAVIGGFCAALPLLLVVLPCVLRILPYHDED